MTIKVTGGNLHWNYFLALERDLEAASRYVEFCDDNLDTYSIEFAHLLFAAPSEVDVIAKLLCGLFDPGKKARNINEYCEILMSYIPQLPQFPVFVPRYGIPLTPWDNWPNE